MLTITSPRGTAEEQRQRKGIWLSARVHPGESNSSLIMTGVLEFLAGSSPEAELLRSLYVFTIVPMLNPDGVINGHYRCNLLGFDLNRQWKDPSAEQHPTIFHAKETLRKFCAEREVIMFVDIHGHSVKHNLFMYGCDTAYWGRDGDKNAPPCPHEKYAERVFPNMMTLTSSAFSLEDSHFVVEKTKERTGRVIAWREFGITNAFTLEASLCGAGDGKRCTAQYTEVDLKGMGRSFCLALTMFSSKYLEQDDGRYQAHVARFLEQAREEEAAADAAERDRQARVAAERAAERERREATQRRRREAQALPPPPPPPPTSCTKWTRRVPHPVLIGHAAALSQALAGGVLAGGGSLAARQA